MIKILVLYLRLAHFFEIVVIMECKEVRIIKDVLLTPKKEVLLPEIGWVKMFLSLIHPHSRMCIRICIFNFKKQANKQNKNKNIKKQ